MSATMDMSTYGNRVNYFISSVSSCGMSDFQAAMCLLKAKELRSAYTESNDIQNAEDNILNELRYWLRSLSYTVHPDTFVAVHWEAVVGGVEEGDDNILYVVPPGGHPIAVPLPYQTEGEQTPIAELAQAIAEAPVPQEEVPVPQGVEQILDAWSKPVEPKKQDTEVFEAKWSPSSAHRWMECPASMAEELSAQRRIRARRGSDALELARRHEIVQLQQQRQDAEKAVDEKAERAGLSASIRSGHPYHAFKELMVRRLLALSNGDDITAQACQNEATPLFSQLNRLRTEARATPAIIPNCEVTENMPVISPPQEQRSLDLLREKERKAKYKRNRTRKR